MIRFGGKGWIGLDIGTYSIKAAQVEKVDSELRLVDSVIVPRRLPLAFRQDQPGERLSFLNEVQAAVALGREFSGRKAACILPMPFQNLRTLTIPKGSQNETRAMIASELATTWGSVANQQFDYWNAANTASDSNDVYVLSMPRELAKGAATDIRRAGLECQAIDGLPFTMARSVNSNQRTPSDTTVAVIDWGYSSTTFCVAIGGRPCYCRSMPDCTLRHLLEPIGKGLGIPEVRQHHLLMRCGLPNTDDEAPSQRGVQDSIAELASGVLSEFREQVEKTMNYLSTHRPQIAPRQIWLTGGGATIPNIQEYLNRELSFPIQIPNSNHCQKVHQSSSSETPVALLTNAIALSALRWESNEGE